jgi:hypothetical protein
LGQRTATAPTAIFANRVDLRDEIDHARLGWAHFAGRAVTPPQRLALRSWSPAVVRVNVAQWKTPDRFLPLDGIPAQGHLSQAEQEEVVMPRCATS